MNATQKIEHTKPVSREKMLAALDAAIRGASDKNGFRTGWIVKCKFDSAMLLAVLEWVWETRVAQLNEDDAGQTTTAHQGHSTSAPSSSLNGEADGHIAAAPHEGHEARAVASSSPSNGDGQLVGAVASGRKLAATPLLPNEDDVGHTADAHRGQSIAAPSSSPEGDGDGLCCDGQKARLSVAAPSPIHRQPSAGHIRAALRAEMRASERILSSLDTYRIDGCPIGDMTMLECRHALERGIETATVLRQILRHTANAPANARVRDVIKAADLDAMIDKAKVLADVA